MVLISMSYHVTVMSLCEIFGSQAPPAAEIDAIHSFQPQKLTSAAMESVGSLVLLYRASHGWKSMPVVMMHYFVIVGVYSIHRLQARNAADGRPENQHKWVQVLAASVSGLWHMNLSWPFCRFFLRTIQLVLKSSNISDVPSEVLNIFRDIDSRIWTPTTAKSLSSVYIIHQLPDRKLSEERLGTSPSRSPSRVADTECVEDVINALDSVSIA